MCTVTVRPKGIDSSGPYAVITSVSGDGPFKVGDKVYGVPISPRLTLRAQAVLDAVAELAAR